MTAAQLIAQLRQCDPDSPVFVTIDGEECKVTAIEDCVSWIDIQTEEPKE